MRQQVEQWLNADPDPSTRRELIDLAENDPISVGAIFDGRIQFGTAGLRAPMGPGPTRMNRLVVRQTTAGVMRWLGTQTSPKVVIGFDARHRSKDFARDVAETVIAMGGLAELFEQAQPTPVLALAVLERGADAGVMITASHNPAADNGYKLYLRDGIQLVSPSDSEIAAEIDQVVAEGGAVVTSGGLTGVTHIGAEASDAHLQAAVGALQTDHRDVQVLYTAMHGVGGKQLVSAFESAGFAAPQVVAEQFNPDPDFPTVSFPNPEEHGALDLAFSQAQHSDVDVVLANDPDADRLAVAVPDTNGVWHRLTGDQVGILLADHLLASTRGENRLVASSIVSSTMIEAMALDAGVESVRSLTGFKWVARPIVSFGDKQYIFGYEEALGYCVGDKVRDKDGISAALVVAEIVAAAKAAGETLWTLLDRLYQRHGVYLTEPVTLNFTGPDSMASREHIMRRIVSDPPHRLGSIEVSSHENLAQGRSLPPTQGVLWSLVDGSRVVVRPSGTEPKLKAYLEVVMPVEATDPGALARAKDAADQRMVELRAAVSDLLGGS